MNFNPDKFDFWKIYEAIKGVYPIGINRENSKMFFSYPGLKELEHRIVENIHQAENFSDRWKSFTKELEKELGKEIVGTTNGQAPSFSSYVLLDKISSDEFTRTKELHFFVSLVGPFYTLIGQDTNTVKIEGQGTFGSTSYLVLSPELEFADAFHMLCERIESRFQGFRFVPFDVGRQTIEGLSVPYSDKKLNSVFHALFNDHIDLTIPSKIGKDHFKLEDWIKEGYVEGGEDWRIFPPSHG
ncbi:hypothetical protein [Algoriphagus taiwanensis]|uniref:DUF3396 domain-containing protein n=1 Tax=Algoriphagus taiwanensis TaxID=1445656 RepID=A0ABQ6Q420_9BACT|nr:hypothetical protein Ataiwa_28900 [Algoriphagus taiwanensis]